MQVQLFLWNSLRCGLLPWFTPEIIAALLADEEKNVIEEAAKTVAELPFIEKFQGGYTYHSSTRKGILEKYAEEAPDEIVAAWEAAVPLFLQNWDNDEAALAALYGLVVTGQTNEAKQRIDQLLERLPRGEGESGFFDIIDRIYDIYEVLDEAESLGFSIAQELTANQLVLGASFHLAKGEADRALAECDRAIQIEPEHASSYAQRGGIYLRPFRENNYPNANWG